MNKALSTILRKEEIVDNGISYSYELLMREGDSTAAWRMPLYSVKVNMTDLEGNSREANARDIFSDVKKATAFFEKIVKNLATPIDLAYVVEDEMTNC